MSGLYQDLLRLISDILDLAKIEAGTFNFVYADLDVNEVCSEIIKSTGMKVKGNIKLLFEKQIPECHIYTDKNRFMQVITNFINNDFLSVKASLHRWKEKSG